MNGGATEFFKLALDLTRAPAKMVHPLAETFKQAGEAAAQQWAHNARATSGVHGKWYPESIDSEARFTLTGNVEVEVGPNSAKKQGRMGRGFEFGSVNQPPHLDGVKAFEVMEPRVESMTAATIGYLLP